MQIRKPLTEEDPSTRANRGKPHPKINKQRELKDDGRYIIFYDFGDEATEEAGGSEKDGRR